MARLELVSSSQMEEAVRKILAKKRRTRCFRCGGEIRIRLQHCTRKPNPVAPTLKEMGIPEPQIGAREWYEVTALVCSQCGTEIEPYEEIRILNVGAFFGELTITESYLGRDGRPKTRAPQRVSWERRRKHDLYPAVGRFHQRVQEWLTQNFRTCPSCGGFIDYRWESHQGKIETVYYDAKPGTVRFRLPSEPVWYDVVVSVFCRERCRRKFPIPAEIETMNEAARKRAEQTHYAPRPRSRTKAGTELPRRLRLLQQMGKVRPLRLEELECTCPDFCLLHTPMRAAAG